MKMEEWEGGKEKDKVFPVLRHESQSSERFSHEWGVNQIPEPRTHMFEWGLNLNEYTHYQQTYTACPKNQSWETKETNSPRTKEAPWNYNQENLHKMKCRWGSSREKWLFATGNDFNSDALHGGNMQYKYIGINKYKLRCSHPARQQHLISHFLLTLCLNSPFKGGQESRSVRR